jgi:hypothetical protein
MPIKDKSLYPKDWKEIRNRILEREGHKCKFCRVENYACVKWDKTGKEWERACGNIHLDQLGMGDCDYKSARFAVDHWNEIEEDRGWIVIVLTIMHLDHNPGNNEDSNLAAGCQRCHNNYDAAFRRKNAAATRKKKKGLQELF